MTTLGLFHSGLKSYEKIKKDLIRSAIYRSIYIFIYVSIYRVAGGFIA